eukprot:6748183-Heterocapsa_arctica.AAC.1
MRSPASSSISARRDRSDEVLDELAPRLPWPEVRREAGQDQERRWAQAEEDQVRHDGGHHT